MEVDTVERNFGKVNTTAFLLSVSTALAVLAWLSHGSLESCCPGLRHHVWVSIVGVAVYGMLWASWLVIGSAFLNRMAFLVLAGGHSGLLLYGAQSGTLCVLCLAVALSCAILAVMWNKEKLHWLLFPLPGALMAYALMGIITPSRG